MSGPAARLDRLLANLGYGSRKEVQAMIAGGDVVLDGAPARRIDTKVTVTADLTTRLFIGGRPVDPPPPLTLMLHKPLGVVCSHREPGRSVYELFPRRWRARQPVLSSVGRLDGDTTGLLLVTDDGGLLHRVISPKNHIAKRYHVTLARPLEGHEAAAFAAGTLMLDGEDKPLAPARLNALSAVTAWLTISEGRYHQVRRMFAAMGNHVEALHRDRIGGLDLPEDLAPGRWRLMDETHLAAVFSAPATT
jgi:16S rRNA pseudouridine516 synthase